MDMTTGNNPVIAAPYSTTLFSPFFTMGTGFRRLCCLSVAIRQSLICIRQRAPLLVTMQQSLARPIDRLVQRGAVTATYMR